MSAGLSVCLPPSLLCLLLPLLAVTPGITLLRICPVLIWAVAWLQILAMRWCGADVVFWGCCRSSPCAYRHGSVIICLHVIMSGLFSCLDPTHTPPLSPFLLCFPLFFYVPCSMSMMSFIFIPFHMRKLNDEAFLDLHEKRFHSTLFMHTWLHLKRPQGPFTTCCFWQLMSFPELRLDPDGWI